MCRVFYTKIQNIDTESPKQRRQRESRVARRLLCKAAEMCGYKYLPEMEERTKTGKPIIKNAEWCFSIAHCKDTVLVAVSAQNVGVDIQRIGDVSEKVVERFLKKSVGTPLENTFAWTGYEALGKYLGTGIPLPDEIKEEFRITEFTVGDYAISVCHGVNEECYEPQALIGVNEG